MSRQYPAELYLGQRVFVRVDPTAHPIAARVTKIDHERGVLHVDPIGYEVRWQAHPRAVSNDAGEFLHFKNNQFYFDVRRSLA